MRIIDFIDNFMLAMVEIFAIKILPPEVFELYRPALMAMLPPESTASVLKFKKDDDFQRSLLGESLTRNRLTAVTGIPAGELQIKRSEKGKPIVQGFPSVHFNISHSGHWVVAALSNLVVGIDVEKIRPPEYRIAERFFSEIELQALNLLEGDEKRNYFFDLWTLKESYLKMVGKGLTQSLGSFTMKKSDNGFILWQNGREDITTYFYQPSLDPDYKLSVCCRSPVFSRKISLTKIDELLNQHGDGKNE